MNGMDGYTQAGNGYTARHALVISADQSYHFHMDNIDIRALAMLRDAPGNAVVYSEGAWASARKASSGGEDAFWFPDSGAHRTEHLSAAEMVAWVTDWQMMTPLSYPPADDVGGSLHSTEPGEEEFEHPTVEDAGSVSLDAIEALRRLGRDETKPKPIAWAIYGRATGALKRVTTDDDVAAEEAEFYDVVPLFPREARP